MSTADGDRVDPNPASEMRYDLDQGHLLALIEKLDGMSGLLPVEDTVALRRVFGLASTRSGVSGRVMALLRSLSELRYCLPVDQLTHSLQTAWRSQEAGADVEIVVAALCHDIGKVIPHSNHAAVAADLLAPYVRPEVVQVVRAHTRFAIDRDPYRDAPWFELAEMFVDEWDAPSFDPDLSVPELECYEARVREVFSLH